VGYKVLEQGRFTIASFSTIPLTQDGEQRPMRSIMPDGTDGSHPRPTKVPFDQICFRVALSFPGEKRALIEDVADRLAEKPPPQKTREALEDTEDAERLIDEFKFI